MKYAAIGPVAIHLPETVESNEFLRSQYPKWDMELVFKKTGIQERHIAAPGECSSDLGVAAAEKLFAEHNIDRNSIDFLLFCTQTPDYPLPTTACLIQERLRLPRSIGALDYNLGCSGFVYGLSLANGLIRTGTARRILLITAETYSKFIDPTDRSLRTIFGDGAAATLVEASDQPSLGSFVFGTDGSGADMLLVAEGGARPKETALQSRKRRRWPSSLYMDGPELVKFSIDIAPPLVDQVLASAKWRREDVDMYLIHQATVFMLNHLRECLSLDLEHTPEALREYGNTVSSTIPILIHDLRRKGRLRPGKQSLMMGFGVGLSWAGCVWTETWAADQVQVDDKSEKKVDAAAEKPAATSADKQPSADGSDDSREAA
ncbi:MAG: ketoacyl-ACP synthase III [Planctomycetaceae bacterium]|nr:ketoacyl-ACP synthase III [Planctomycetaceae bacterium]